MHCFRFYELSVHLAQILLGHLHRFARYGSHFSQVSLLTLQNIPFSQLKLVLSLDFTDHLFEKPDFSFGSYE